MTSPSLVDSALGARDRRTRAGVERFGRGSTDVVATAALAVGVAAFVVYVGWLQRDTWFWFDDFTWLTEFHDGSVFEPAKSHLSVVPGTVVFLVANVFGLEHGFVVMWWFALATLAALAVTIWWHLRSRIGSSAATLASLAVLWFAPNHVDVLNPTFVKHTMPLLLAILVAGRLERRSSSRTDDAWTALLVAIAIGCSTTGLVLLAIVGAHVAGTTARPARWWLLFSPGAAWLVWYAIAENSEQQSGLPRAYTPNVREFLRHADQLVSNTFVDLGGGNPAVGFALGVGFVLVIALSALRWKTCTRSTLGWIAAATAFVVLTSAVQNMFVLGLGEPPRYRFVLAVFVLLAAGEAVRGITIDIRILGTAGVLLTANALVLIDGLQGQHSFMRSALAADAPLLLGAEAAGTHADPDRQVTDISVDLTSVGEYQDLIDHVGSPRDFLAGVQFNSDAATEADRLLLADIPLDIVPGACAELTSVPAASLTVAPGSTVSVNAIGGSAEVFVVRFGEFRFGLAPIVTLDDGESMTITLPDDEITVPWKLKGTPGAVLTAC